LLAFERNFSAMAGPFDARTSALLADRQRALEDLATLSEVIATLKMRAPLRAIAAVVKRPRAMGVVLEWIREAMRKRITKINTR
jgi:hypothetical protein